MMTVLRDALIIAGKDITNELKSKQTVGMMVIFSILVILIFSFAFDPSNRIIRSVIPGLIWVITIFSGILGLNRSFVCEFENSCLLGLRMAPVDPVSIYLGKAGANFIFVAIVQLISIPLLFILFDYTFNGSLLWLLAIIFFGTYGFIIIGTFLAALAANAKNSEMLLPLLLLPLISPLIIAAVQATGVVLENETIREVISWVQLMVGYDLLFTAICILLFDYILEDA